MTKAQKDKVLRLRHTLEVLETNYMVTHDSNSRDKIIRIRREILKLEGVDLSADLTLADVDVFLRGRLRKGHPLKAVKKF